MNCQPNGLKELLGQENATLWLMIGDAQSLPDAFEASGHWGGTNMLPSDLLEVIEQDHRALDAIVKGDQATTARTTS
jgi:hypothetical protein